MAEPQPGRGFEAVQRQLAAHLRDPGRQPGPADVEDRRLAIYRELFYNNIEGFLANAFPVLRRILPDPAWHSLVREFYARHRCRAPEFYRVAEEFLDYLDGGRAASPAEPPFLRELCHYEWVELALAIDEAELSPQLADPNGDLLDGVPVISPLAWALRYEYPVHRIGPDFTPREPGPEPTFLVVSRNRRDEVRFLEINPVTARLIELIETGPSATGRALLTQIAIELQHPKPHQVVESGARTLATLRERDIVLGTAR